MHYKQTVKRLRENLEEKQQFITYKGFSIGEKADFSSEIMEARKQWDEKVTKSKKHVNQEIYIWQYYLQMKKKLRHL